MEIDRVANVQSRRCSDRHKRLQRRVSRCINCSCCSISA